MSGDDQGNAASVSAMGPSREELHGGEPGGSGSDSSPPANSMASNISDHRRRLAATLIELVPQTKAPAASHGEAEDAKDLEILHVVVGKSSISVLSSLNA